MTAEGGNDEARMSNVETRIRILSLSVSFQRSSFVIGHSSFRAEGAFTIIELLVVISIIIILVGLILSTVGYVQKKGARSRVEAEIAAISAALESYKADNGIYSTDTTTNALDARQNTDATQKIYQDASLFLFKQLSGLNADQTPISGAKSYFTFKPQMLGGTRDANGKVNPVSYIRDPFGNSYGYSTAANPQANPTPAASPVGYNPTFDLWSTASSTDPNQWIKNW